MKAIRDLAFGCFVFLVAYGPLYRYLRGLMNIDLLSILPYGVMGLLFVLGCIMLPVWWRQGVTQIDRAVMLFSVLIAISVVIALTFYEMEFALTLARSYVLPLGAYYVARGLTVDKIDRLMRIMLLFSLFSVFFLIFEFYQINVAGIDPRESIVAVAYTRAPDFDPREYQAYFNQEAWKLPVIGYIVRPFGTLGAPQISGIYYAFMFWLTYFFVGPKGSSLRRLYLAFFVMGIFLTNSRTAMIGLISVTVLVIFKNSYKRYRIPMIIATIVTFCVVMYPSFEALLNPERRVGILNSAIFLKDVFVFFGKEFNAIMQMDIVGFLFGVPKDNTIEGFEGGIISNEYYFNQITDVGILQVILEIGALPTIAFIAAFVVSHRTFLKQRAFDKRFLMTRESFIFSIWVLLIIGSVHYLAITVYCMNLIIMLVLAYISRQSYREFCLMEKAREKQNVMIPHILPPQVNT